MSKSVCISALMAALVVVSPIELRAQQYEDIGTRAQGLSGAFVGLADDATAVWWNPAGLATGAFLGLIIEKGRVTQPESPTAFAPARRATPTGFALGFPALGVSYYRLRISEIAESQSTEPLLRDRQDDGGTAEVVRSRAFSQFGITIGQSLADYLVVGSTLKLVRGGEGTTVIDPSADVLDQGDDIDLSQETRGDLDLGVMLAFPNLKVGMTVRNLTTPEFGEGNNRFELKRKVRAGIAVLARPKSTVQSLAVTSDVDLTRTATPFGDVRHVALGGEAWLGGHLGLRGGVAANTIGERRTTTSTGASVKMFSVMYIDAAWTFGSDQSVRGWSTSARIAY